MAKCADPNTALRAIPDAKKPLSTDEFQPPHLFYIVKADESKGEKTRCNL